MYLRKQTICISTVALTMLSGMAQPSFTQEPVAPMPPAARPRGGAAPGISPGSGPYKAIMEADPTLPTHTIYRPTDLNAIDNKKLPVILWAEGGCANIGNRFQFFLTDIASYGYVAIAIGPIVVGGEQLGVAPPPPPGGARPPAPAAGARPAAGATHSAATHPAQLFDALNWAIAESKRPDSRYFGKLDTEHVAVMGQSCGGVQALEAAADPRITTAVIWDSGLFPQPSNMGGGKSMSKDDLKLLHTPVAYITGDAQDVAFPNANDDFDKIENVPIFRGWERGVPHLGTYREPNGGEFSGVGVAWLNWRLKGDTRAALMFKGKDCGLCVNPKWVVSKKKID